ncbi:MAG: hypothetical protein IKL52_05320 [Candidatus Gastranaerophilales bacterium]|jgi:hypothetical protein|nr:hypothetical protein [Candidatus Gastranaerophilales bacterium]
MNNIKNIRLSGDDFIIESETSSLKLTYKDETDKYIIDISSMNLINATKTAIFASTFCFIKNFKKKLCWLVKDEETKRAISVLRLKNVEQQIKENIQKESVVLAS